MRGDQAMIVHANVRRWSCGNALRYCIGFYGAVAIVLEVQCQVVEQERGAGLPILGFTLK